MARRSRPRSKPRTARATDLPEVPVRVATPSAEDARAQATPGKKPDPSEEAVRRMVEAAYT